MKIILLILGGLLAYLICIFPFAVFVGEYFKKVRKKEESFWLKRWLFEEYDIWLEWPREDVYDQCSLKDWQEIARIIDASRPKVLRKRKHIPYPS